jgi:polyhydroxyalkanoate synthesis repressor PhaR
MSDVRVIKRYANRKLYDTQHSRYVTLDQISEMIREGDDVKIIDNKSKEDLTSVTLAQIIFEEEKKQKSFLPLQTMRNIIQTGGESINQLVAQAQSKVEEVQRKVTDILPHKEDEQEGGEEVAPDTELAEAAKPGPLAIREFREFLVNSQRTIDEWQRRMDDRIRNVVEGISPFRGLHTDVQSLAERIAELEAKLSVMVEEEEEKAKE